MMREFFHRVGPKTEATPFTGCTVVSLMLVAALAYAWFLSTFLSPYAAGADASGYLNFARLLVHGEIRAPVRALLGHAVTEFGEGTFQPQGFSVRDDSGLMSPTYPVGFPLHLALATWLVGSEYAVGIVNIVAALAAGALLYASCRHLKLRPAWAAAATGGSGFAHFF